MNEIEQILTEHNLDLQRNREQLKSIRRGEWSIEQVDEYFARKEMELETLYTNSNLPWGPDEEAIKILLLQCLEEHYGSLDDCIVTPDQTIQALREIADVIYRNRRLFE